jgi:hypothetical protein
MHDQSASRVSGRTRAAVSAMCVRALRITVLESAGNFTRYERHHLSAEKIQRVNYFVFARSEFFACQQFSNAGAAGWVRKFQVAVNRRSGGLLRRVRSTHGNKHQTERIGASALGPSTDLGLFNRDFRFCPRERTSSVSRTTSEKCQLQKSDTSKGWQRPGAARAPRIKCRFSRSHLSSGTLRLRRPPLTYINRVSRFYRPPYRAGWSGHISRWPSE